MAVVTALPVGPSHWGGTHAAAPFRHAYIDVAGADKEPIYIDRYILFIRLLRRVGDCRTQHFLYRLGCPLVCKTKDGESLIHIAATNRIDDQACLLRLTFNIFCNCVGFHY